MGAEGARLLERSFDNMWIGMIRVMRLGARLVEEAYPDVLAACQTADLVVTSDTGSGVVEAEKLAHAITQALTDTAMRAKAAALGAAIRSGPDGVTQAVQWIEQ
jgi:hypothetical protein